MSVENTAKESIKVTFDIPGMDCPVEENLIREKLKKISGIENLEFNLLRRRLGIEYQENSPGQDKLQEITGALNSLDMGAVLQNPSGAINDINKDKVSGAGDKAIPHNEIPWKKIIIAAIFAVVSEILDILPGPEIIGPFSIYSGLSFICALIAIGLAGLGTFKKGWIAVKNLNLNMNALMSVAVTAAICIGQYPEAAAVIVLFELSEAIESKALTYARNAVQKLLAMAPNEVEVFTDHGHWHQMPVDQAKIGQLARVKPGEKIALDGVVVSGHSTVNQAPITGESMPVEKSEGDFVYAGTINQNGSLEYKISSLAGNSTLARIIHAVEQAQATRAPIQRFVDIFAKYYTPCVFILAILFALVPPLAWGAGWMSSIYTSLVILIIGCPCALVISTPVSVVSGMTAATKSGILVKGGIFMEQGRLLRWLALDKTGTITEGKPKLVDFQNLGNMDKKDVMEIAAGLCGRSDHPVSQAIAQAETSHLTVMDFQARPGEGISGKINGEQWSLGNLRMLKSFGVENHELENKIISLEKSGKTIVALFGKNEAQALFAVADTIRPTSIQAIEELKKLNVTAIMLTGDNEHTAQAIAQEVGISEWRANMLPQDKLKLIEHLETREGKTGMVGDGINDAPALAKADISFAMAKEGTDTAIETADIALMDDDLRKIPRFIKLSRDTFTILLENIILALAIKIIFFILAITGYATMWMAVFADVGATILVVYNGLRAAKK